ncbi:unnamed protein product [Lymnaea stagnalis]|uniref:Uncharacterized protein n=1 Tax=Lymnaea stagnalis TaxID=6523 RepID=A0AAV2H4V0_LYMST
MKSSGVQGMLLVCLFLVIRIIAADVSFTFFYLCNSSLCEIIIWFSEYGLQRFRDCLCSATTSACYFYNTHYQGYYQGYYQSYNYANEIYQLPLNNNLYEYPAQFTCTYGTYQSRNYIVCSRILNESGNYIKTLQFNTETETNKCDFMCVDMVSSHIYDIFIGKNNIINVYDTTARCSTTATKVTTKEKVGTFQPTTSEISLTVTSTSTTSLLSTVANPTKLHGYNASQTNTSAFGEARNGPDFTTDIGLITGVITAIVAVLVIALVILFLWRRRIRKLNQAKSKDKSKFSETRVTVSDHNVVTFSENDVQTYSEIKGEEKGQFAETKGDYETINSESVVEYATVKKKTERHQNIVPTPIKQEINVCPSRNEINIITSVDSTAVVLDHQYCNVNSDTAHIQNSYGKQNLNKTSKRRSGSAHSNIARSHENQVETNNMKDTHPVPFDHLAHINNTLSDNESSAAYANTPTQTTADVYTKLGDQNKELTNPYNTLFDKSG